MTDEAETRLDRIARDASRTWLHGSRVTDLVLAVRPATVATGQQIPVELPEGDPMKFTFAVGGATTTVLVSQADASKSEKQMADAVGANATKYLTLSADSSIPTWVAAQRTFSIPNPVPDEDRVDHVAAPGAPAPTLIKLPYAALGEVKEPDACVSLCRYDSDTKALVEIPRSAWQPALLLRFKLQPAPPAEGLGANEQLFEISGTPQGDRYYLDHLGLLDAALGRVSEPNPPGIVSVGLALQNGSKDKPLQVSDWTILRTNLTREARSASVRAAFATTPALPYVALSGADIDQAKDALRLLQMISITNSGGYYLRVADAPAGADTLVLSVVLNTRPDGDTNNLESAWLPRAANAVALTGTMPDSIRFNGVNHLQIAPAVPVGVLSFGWTRSEPANITDPEDKFGFGTISLVDYAALDGAGAPVGAVLQDTVIAISPTNPPPGDPFPRHQPQAVGAVADEHHRHTGDTAMLKLGASGRRPRALAAEAEAPVLRYYRSTLTCYDDKAEESPYLRMGDPQRSQVVFTPGFRDVFGNRFAPVAAPPVQRRLFYTDALIAPSEWPGIRFAIHPDQQGGKPFLSLEIQYRFLGAKESKDARIKRLKEICNQLRGVQGDVTVVLSADPLASVTHLSAADLADQIGVWIASEHANTVDRPDPLVRAWAAVPCNGAISDLKCFQPRLTISRARTEFGPSATDLPDDGTVAGQITKQVMSAVSDVALQASSSLSKASKDETDAEFRAIAEAFQTMVAKAAGARTGFLRDRLNRHELWFVPNAFFPAPAAATVDWSFATARPLSTRPGAETFGVPDFNASCSAVGPDCWNGRPIVMRTVVDQDYDELGRTALRLMEQQSVQLGAMSARANVGAARKLLAAREQAALALASFQGDGGPGYVVPLFAKAGDVEPASARRIASDAFLSDLNAFYNIDTILQLPLATYGNEKILTFEGKVSANFVGPAGAACATLSGLLLGGGERKVTLLYDLPPGLPATGEVQKFDKVTARIHHVQLPLQTGTSGRGNSFNQGAWLELALPDEIEMTWMAPADGVQVADRRLPAKPMIQSAGTLLSGQNALKDPVVTPAKVDASDARRLVRWGWQFTLGLLAPGKNDRVHITATYNRPQATALRLAAAGSAVWMPQSLLNVLFAFKMLNDAPAALAAGERLQAAAELADFLVARLTAQPLRSAALAALPLDHFFIPVQNPGTPSTSANQDVEGCTIMKGAVSVDWAGDANQVLATVTAKSDTPDNGAYLTGVNPVRNLHLALRLLRNETLGPRDIPANASLIYECATVESPVDYWARNVWPAPIRFDAGGKPLQGALQDFFDSLLQKTDLSNLKLEVGASLVWQAGKLNGVTPFCILPPDIKPGNGTAGALATFVFDKYDALLKTGAPTGVGLALRLRVKLATPDDPPQQRTLLDMAAIDFPI